MKEGRAFLESVRFSKDIQYRLIKDSSKYAFKIVGDPEWFWVVRRGVDENRSTKAYGPFTVESFPYKEGVGAPSTVRIDISKDCPTHYREGIRSLIKELFGYKARKL